RTNPGQDELAPSNCGASIRYDKVVDGIDALPDEKTQERKNRNGAPRSGVQHETGDAHSGCWRIDGGDPSMRRAAQANWSRLPNHNLPPFYTAWTRNGHSGDDHFIRRRPRL